VAGSFSVKLGFLSDHTGLIVGIVIGGLVLIASSAAPSAGGWRACDRRSPAAAR
jgi:hypothetical protein